MWPQAAVSSTSIATGSIFMTALLAWESPSRMRLARCRCRQCGLRTPTSGECDGAARSAPEHDAAVVGRHFDVLDQRETRTRRQHPHRFDVADAAARVVLAQPRVER